MKKKIIIIGILLIIVLGFYLDKDSDGRAGASRNSKSLRVKG